jgi:hypothetical protein
VRLRARVVEGPDGELDAFLAGLADCLGRAGCVDSGGHVCVGQATTGVRMTLLLGALSRRIRITASAIISTVGKITASRLNFRSG